MVSSRKFDMDAAYERLMRAAEVSESLPEVDLAKVSAAASKAYWDASAKKAEVLTGEIVSLAAKDSAQMLATAWAHLKGDQENENEFESLIERINILNQAASVVLTAIRAGESPRTAQDIVNRTTAVQWTETSAATGAIFTRADRFSTTADQLQVKFRPGRPPILASYLKAKSGQAIRGADYIGGKVVRVELKKIYLDPGDGSKEEFIRSPGMLPPLVNSEVVAVVKNEHEITYCMAAVDSKALGLKRYPG